MPEPRAATSDKIDVVLPDLQVIQEAFKVVNGRYLQLPATHTVTPIDGGSVAGDDTKSAARESVSWADLGIKVPAGLALEVYQHITPNGPEFTLYATVDVGGTVYRQAHDSDPTSYRHSPRWTVVPADRTK